MTAPDPLEITELLQAMADGRPGATDALVPLVYEALHELATRALQREAVGHTLQPTALVHEAFLRMVDRIPGQFENRSHFYAFAARIMRRVLVDQARARLAFKRGGGMRVALEGLAVENADDVEQRTLNVIAIEDALLKLEQLDARSARVVELRVFAGLNAEEAAQTLDVSLSTVKRDWQFARAFLVRELKASRQ